jgi:hypothetical protein
LSSSSSSAAVMVTAAAPGARPSTGTISGMLADFSKALG